MLQHAVCGSPAEVAGGIKPKLSCICILSSALQCRQSVSDGAERRHEVLNQETCGLALTAWQAKTPFLGACKQHQELA